MLGHDSLQKRIFICILLTVLIVVIIALGIVYSNSSRVIRSDALNFLNISMNNIENEFVRLHGRMEDNLLRVSINDDIAYGCLARPDMISYEGYRTARSVESTLINFMGDEGYLDRIVVVTEDGTSFSTDSYIIRREQASWLYEIASAITPGSLFSLLGAPAIARPVYSSDMKIVGECIFILNQEMMDDAFEAFEIPNSIVFTVFDGDKILGGDISSVSASFASIEAFLSTLAEHHNSTIIIDGSRYFVSIRNIADTDMAIFGLVPYRSLIIDSIRILWITVAMLIISIVSSVLISWFLSKLICRELRIFRISMLRISQGDIHERMQLPSEEELRDLAVIFNMMMDRITNLIDESSRKEVEKEKMRWDYLNEQIKPHFIYNTLNNIRYLAVSRGQSDLAEATSSTVELLRAAIGKHDEYVSLEEELNYAIRYVELYNFRTSGNLRLDLDIPEKLLNVRIPILALEPLVENAALHGYGNQPNGIIWIRGTLDNDGFIHLVIHDEGAGFDVESVRGLKLFGIGVENVLERFRLIYGDDFSSKLHSAEGKGTTVELRFRAEDA